MQTCQWSILVPGPHPGCAEFAPPDVMTCPDEATYLVRVDPVPYYPGDDGVSAFCGFHAATETVEETVAIADLPMTCTGCGEPVWAKYPERHAIGGCSFYPPRCAGADHAFCSCPEEAAYLAAMSEPDDDPRHTDRGLTVAERNGER